MFIRIVLLLTALSFSLPTGADEYSEGGSWIVAAGTDGSLNIQTGTPKTTTISVSAAVGHTIFSSFELLLIGSYASVTNPGLPPNSANEILGQLNWVFVGGSSDALYVGARGGRRGFNRYGVTASDMIFGGVLGKRFALGGAVSYAPEAGISFVNTSGAISTPAFRVTPLRFALVF